VSFVSPLLGCFFFVAMARTIRSRTAGRQATLHAHATAPDTKSGYDSADRVNDPVVGGSGFAEVEHGVKAGTFTADAALSSVGLPTPITEKYLHLHSEATEQGNSASTLMSVLVTQCYYARA
jgi:hypothetical protein